MKIVNSTYYGLAVFSLCLSMEVLGQMSFGFLPGEGGDHSVPITEKFETHMAKNQCLVKVDLVDESDADSTFFFSAKPLSTISELEAIYEPLASVRTYNNHPLTVALLVKSSRGIDELKSTEGERLSVISQSSYLGWEKVKALYDERGVKIDQHDIYETEHYEGAITLLLHGDVFVAAIPGPLAHRWAKANGLTVIAESETLDIGDIWIKKSVSSEKKEQCRVAITSLERKTRRDKRLNVFPAWVEGFKIHKHYKR